MKRQTLIRMLAICAVATASCSETPNRLQTPTGASSVDAAVNADGSTLKVTAPGALSPNGGQVDSRRPALSFSNSAGRFQAVGLAYEIEVQDASGAIVYGRLIGESSGTSRHTLESDLAYATTYWWRARARLSDQVGPWSDFGQFRTLDPPVTAPPPTVPGGGLPFPIPEACGPGGPDNRFACAAAIAAQSVEWRGCAGGRGVSCHRFTRQVVYALAQSDPNWKMIQAAPGGNACNCSGCGPSDGTMFREDTTVYGGNRVFDLIVGAGGPSPSLGWSPVPGPRPGDIPLDAPLCQ